MAEKSITSRQMFVFPTLWPNMKMAELIMMMMMRIRTMVMMTTTIKIEFVLTKTNLIVG